MQTLQSCSHQLGKPAQKARAFFSLFMKIFKKKNYTHNFLFMNTVLKTYVQKLSVKIFYNHIIFINISGESTKNVLEHKRVKLTCIYETYIYIYKTYTYI